MAMPDASHPQFQLPAPFSDWFAGRGWTPRPHQLDLAETALAGESALLIAPTGGGKTLAGFLGSLIELSERKRAANQALKKVSETSKYRMSVPVQGTVRVRMAK